MSVLEVLTIAYIIVGLVVSIMWIWLAWKGGNAFLFLLALAVAGFIPAFWGPLLVIGVACFALLTIIQKMMDLSKHRSWPREVISAYDAHEAAMDEIALRADQ